MTATAHAREQVTRFEDARLRVVSASQLLVAVWLDAPGLEHIRELGRVAREHAESLRGRKQAFINVVLDGTPDFSDEVRQEAARLAERASPWRIAVAHAVEVRGLRGLTVRTFFSTMLLLGKPAVPTKVFAAADEAARWIAPRLDPADAWTPGAIAALCRR